MNKEYLEFAQEIAYYAGEIMKKYFFNGDMNIEYKEDRTPVTMADKIINDYLIDQVNKKYPNHGVEGEEAKKENDNKYVWVCDPIDGTSMFTRHIPISVFSLALVIDGQPVVAVVYDPFLDEMYTAIKGNGAFCNGKPISVNKLKYGEIGSTIDYYMWNKAKYDTLEIIKLIRGDFKISQLGSVSHAAMLVANGKISGVIFPGTSHGHCDIAASKLIVEEAGGKVTNFNGNEQRYDKDIDGAIITNGEIHEEIIKVLYKSLKEDE